MAQNATPGDGERNGARPSPAVAAPNSGELVRTEVPRAYGLAGESARHLSRRAWGLVARRVRHELFMNAMMDRAATLTFFTVLTALPMVLGVYSIATLVLARNEEQVQKLTADFIGTYLPQEWADAAQRVVDAVVGSTQQSTLMLVLSVVLALFSSSAYVRAFARSANAMYGRVEGRGLVRTWTVMWRLTVAMVLGVAVIFVALMLQRDIVVGLLRPFGGVAGVSSVRSFLVDSFLPVWQWLRWPVVAVMSVTLLALLYRFAPNVRTRKFQWLTVGSTIALLGAVVAWGLVRVYLTVVGARSAYGALGTVIIALFALWIMNTLFILGVKIDAEIARAMELERGLESERVIQAPPRATGSAVAQSAAVRELEGLGKEIRLKG